MRRLDPRLGRRLFPFVGHPLAAACVVAVLTSVPIVSAVLFSFAAAFGAFGVSCTWAAAVDVGGVSVRFRGIGERALGLEV